MKIGDKIYCIKSNDTNFKNKVYTILQLDKNIIHVTADGGEETAFSKYRLYYINKKVSLWSKFSDYFVTEKEYRKQKLNKLNGNRG